MNIRKLFPLAVILFMVVSKGFAQNNITVLTREALQQEKDMNKQNGLPYCQGIYVEYKITTTDVAVSAKDSAEIVKNLATITDVVSYSYSPSKHTVNVKSKKEETGKVIKQIKTNLISHKIVITKLEEVNYKLNK